MTDEFQTDQPTEDEGMVCDDCGAEVPAGEDTCPECSSKNLSPVVPAKKEDVGELGKDEWGDDEEDMLEEEL